MSQFSESYNLRPFNSEEHRNPSSSTLRDDPMLTTESAKLLADSSTGEPHSKAPPRTKNATIIIIATILGGWIAAVIFAFAHHWFCMAIRYKQIPDYPTKRSLFEFRP